MSSDGDISLWKKLLRLLQGDRADQNAMRESLEEVIEESERQSPALSDAERVMLSNLLKFGELRLKDVMVPRAAIIAVDETVSMNDLVQLFREAQHSRLPMYRDTLDDPTGLVHVKDVLALLQDAPGGGYRLPDVPIVGLRRPILFVPPSMRALDLLLKMQTSHTHLALVIDEYGGTDGLVSIEDIIEEIVGDIADEHDDEPMALKHEGDSFVADARMELEDFAEAAGFALPVPEDSEGVDSLGGLVVSHLGRVPQRGEIVEGPEGFVFEVLEADPRRVRRLRIRPPKTDIVT